MMDAKLMELARQAGLTAKRNPGFEVLGKLSELAKFADLVAAAERERCANVCELYDSDDNAVDGRHVLAAAIRAMKD